MLQEEDTSYTSPLCELLGTSHTSVLAVPPVVIPDDCMFVSDSVDVLVRGEWCRVVTAVRWCAKFAESSPSSGREFTFPSDLLLTVRGSSTRASIVVACLLCYPGNILCSQHLELLSRAE
jgi:hypothetical protein